MFFVGRVIIMALAVLPAMAVGSVEPRASPVARRGSRLARRGSPTPRGSPVMSPTPTYEYGTAIDSGLAPPLPTEAPNLNNRAPALDSQLLTVKITNSFGFDLPISYNKGADSPNIVGNPARGILHAAQATNVVVPRDFEGAIFIGKTYDPGNSKIEVSFKSNQNWRPGLDVSYVDGYGVPITCSCSGVPVTGCNIPLFQRGTCPRQGPGDRVICYNPEKTVIGGPADPFFQPCQGAAYTYPDDHTANAFGKCDSGNIQCCVGVPCPAPSLQHGTKRSLETIYGNGTHIPDGLC